MKFVDELPDEGRRGTRGRWAEELNPLRERPGQWADLGIYSASLATYLRGRFEEFEFVTRRGRLDAPKARIYARFIGGMES